MPISQKQFTVTKTIAASAARVFDIITTPAGMKAWVPMCRSAFWEHPPGASGIGVGSVRVITLQAGIVAREKIVFWEAGRQLNYTFEPPIIFDKVTTRYEGVTLVKPTGPNSCQLIWTVHFDTPGRQALAKPLVKPVFQALIAQMAANVVRLSASTA